MNQLFPEAAASHNRAPCPQRLLRLRRLHPDAIVPAYQSAGAACFDLHAVIPEGQTISLYPKYSVILNTGWAVEVPPGWALMVYGRSGHGFNHQTRLTNCTGVIDSDYRGALRVALSMDLCLDVQQQQPLNIRHGDRVAQAMLVPAEQWGLLEVDALSETARGSSGFGSTGQGL